MNTSDNKQIRKSRWHKGPASLLTALLLTQGDYQSIRHCVIRSHTSLRDYLDVNDVTIVGYPEIIDMKGSRPKISSCCRSDHDLPPSLDR